MPFVDAQMPAPDATDKQDNDPLALKIGMEIASARKDKGLSVSELHRQTGISRTVIQGYEAGRYRPGAREICLIAEALDCSPNRMLFGHDDFKKRTNLDELFGNEAKAISAAKIGIASQMLTNEEQRTVLSLLALMVEGRVGGRDELSKILAVADQVQTHLENEGDAAEGRLQALVGENFIQGLENGTSPAPEKVAKKKPKRS